MSYEDDAVEEKIEVMESQLCTEDGMSEKRQLEESEKDGVYQLKKPKWYHVRANKISKGKKKVIDRLKHLQLHGLGWQDKVNLATLFPSFGRFALEIGMGDGGNMVSYLRHNDDTAVIGVEIHKGSIADAMQRVEEGGLEGRVRFFGGDAVKFMKRNIQDGVLDEVLIMFPDPWEKDGTMNKQHKVGLDGEGGGKGDGGKGGATAKREAKTAAKTTTKKKELGGDRRIVCKEAVEIIYNKLKVGGELHIATDVESYADHVRELMENVISGFQGGEQKQKRAWREVQTKYEQRGLEFGHTVHDFLYVKHVMQR